MKLKSAIKADATTSRVTIPTEPPMTKVVFDKLGPILDENNFTRPEMDEGNLIFLAHLVPEGPNIDHLNQCLSKAEQLVKNDQNEREKANQNLLDAVRRKAGIPE